MSEALRTLDELENALRDLHEFSALMVDLLGQAQRHELSLRTAGMAVLFSQVERCAARGIAAYERLPRH